MKIKFERGEIVIRIPVTEKTIAEAPLSKSGKAKLVASSGGFQAVDGAPEGVRVNLTVVGKK